MAGQSTVARELMDAGLDIQVEQLRGMLAVLNANLAHQARIMEDIVKRLGNLEHCPCPVKRDPGNECPLFALEKELERVHRRLAAYAGGIAAAVTLLQIGVQLAMKIWWGGN